MKKSNLTYLGIDIGTTSVKALLTLESGELLAESEVELYISRPHAVWSEQEPEMWWDATIKAIKEIIFIVNRRSRKIRIESIGISGQMHSSVFLDKKGNVVRPALLWSDGRTTSQCEQITEKLGFDELRESVGNLALEGFTLPKLLWLQQNEPSHFDQVATLILPKDYIRFRMTGELITDHSDASATLLYDVTKKCWSKKIMDVFNVPDILPPIAQSTDIVGSLTKTSAELCGLETGIPIVCGSADNVAGSLATGVISNGLLQSSIGTSGTLLTPIEKVRIDSQMRLHVFVHAVPDLWYLMGVTLSAGDSLKWLRNIISGKQSSITYDSMMKEAKEINPGSEGLVFLPYLVGERTPHNDSTARGSFIGLHAGHTSGHLIRAVMEGVCFSLKDSLSLFEELEVSSREVRTVGGGSKSKLWRQMQADVYNLPVMTIKPSPGPAYGAAMMATIGAKRFSSLDEVVSLWTTIEDIQEPNSERVDFYQQQYSIYKGIYPSLKDHFKELNSN